MEDEVDRLYREKEVLAPMVRAGSLPMRTLALSYGCDTVWSEETVDKSILKTQRVENASLGTVDYLSGRSAVFQTCPAERGRVIMQLGTADAGLALAAAQLVERDVAAIDINMGCPKRFSVTGGMGAALLSAPDLASDIVKTLRRNLSVPVSCKIRLLDSEVETVELARRLEAAGACALTVHGRTPRQKDGDAASWEAIRPIVDALNIPVIANGDIYTREDMAAVRKLTGCSSVMLARPALRNCSIYRKNDGLLPLEQVLQDYLRECIRYDTPYQNAKYTLNEMLTKRRLPRHLQGRFKTDLPRGSPGIPQISHTKSLRQLAALYGLESVFDDAWRARRENDNTDNAVADVAEVAQPAYEPARTFSDLYFDSDMGESVSSPRLGLAVAAAAAALASPALGKRQSWIEEAASVNTPVGQVVVETAQVGDGLQCAAAPRPERMEEKRPRSRY